jgi:hypothetical protein
LRYEKLIHPFATGLGHDINAKYNIKQWQMITFIAGSQPKWSILVDVPYKNDVSIEL